MAEKPRHLGTWWCACGRAEPRPRLTASEEARLDWWAANGNPASTCACPSEYSRYGSGRKQHTDECKAKVAEAERLREEWGIDGLKARSEPDRWRKCPSCGARMVQARAAGARFPN